MTAEYSADSNSSTTRISDTSRRSGFGCEPRRSAARRVRSALISATAVSVRASRCSWGRGSAGSPVDKLRDQQPSAAASSTCASSRRASAEPARCSSSDDRRHVRLGPAARRAPAAPGAARPPAAACSWPAATGGRRAPASWRSTPDGPDHGRHGVIGARRQPPPVVGDLVQAGQIALGGQLQRRRQQLLLGVEVVGRRGERQLGDLGHAAVRDRVGAGVGDDPQRRLEQRLAAGGAARAGGGTRARVWSWSTDMLVQMYQQRRDVSRVALRAPVLWEATGPGAARRSDNRTRGTTDHAEDRIREDAGRLSPAGRK